MVSNTAQKINASTQKFTEIQDIREDIVLLSGGSACLIIEVEATNFALLSQEEQHAKIVSYASLLNSLSFPIQIVIRNKRVDISSYLKLLDREMQKLASLHTPVQEVQFTSQNEKRITYIKQYKSFVEQLIKVNTVLDKTFYIIVSFSFLEKGARGIGLKKEDFFAAAKASLHTKTESLAAQLGRLGLRNKILQTDALIKLFYDIYNQGGGIGENVNDSLSAPVVKTT